MSVLHDLLELGQHLRQERLFVGMEREQLQKLYEEVRKIGEDLYHASWISRQQKLNLDHLQAMGHDVPSEEICAKNNQLESVNFQDSYKVLGHHDSKYGDLFKYLHENPILLAHCVCTLEKVNIITTGKVIGSIMSAIYGNCVVQEDEHHVLQLLKTLIDVQLGGHDNPRRLIRRGNCAFSLIFKQLSDMLFSTRLFLTAALHDPVMRLLMEDEWFYDIDPDKALVRFPPKERQKRFGEPGSDDYKSKVQNYRKFIVDKLVLLCTRFINSIKSNIHCFPASISWIVAQVFQTLTKGNKLPTGEVRATCADLIFALFICPAICDPEPYGITSDVPISHIARHNLMQMAQIVQVLAISQWDEIDPKLRDLYGRFEKGCMSSFLDCLVEGVGEEVPIFGSSQFQNAARSTVLLTHAQLNILVNCLRNASTSLDDKVPGRKALQELLVCMPSDVGQGHDNHLSALGTSPPTPTPPGTPNNQKKLFRGLKKKNSQVNLQVSAEDGDATDGDSKTGEPIDDILVISLGVGTDCPGMMAENKILSWEQENRRRKVKYNTDINDGGPIEIHEKRTRFSLSHDQESIGNTSDYQEAISEAASSHSVDMENDNDNLSDMMSADVSGRGSPSISGRDTPLSQAGSVEERAPAEFAVPVPETVQKQNRVDVTERFGKFEIKAELERDETKSTVSDTWSTDVLASDSEPPEQNQLERLEEVAEEMGRPPPFLLAPRDADSDNAFPPSLSEMSETASDAWSTDVLASDTDEKQSELLTDLDQDDISMSSVMERSDNLDDQSLEDTPLASGGHSPSGDRDLLGFGAEGGPSVKRADSLGSEEVFSEDVFTDDITPSAETSQLNQTVEAAAADKMPKPEVKAEGQGQNRTSPDSRQSQGRSANNESENRQNATVTSKSDSLSLPKDHHCGARPKEFHKRSHHHHHHNRSHGGYNPAKVEAWAKSNGIGGNKDGPKFGAEFESMSMARSAGGKPVNTQKLPTTATINDQDIDEGIEISVDVNSLVDQVEAVGLSEQQNVKFNENRLSATLSLFDPLSPENSSTGDLLEGAGGISVHPVTTLPAAACPSRMSAPPSFSATQIFPVPTAPSAQRATSEILISVSSSDEVQGQLQSSAETVKSSSQEDLRGGRRDSSDSSHSAASLRLNDTASASKEPSMDTLSMRSNGDNVSMRSDDKDFSENEEKGFDKINKKGFFKSVKEKIHKGIKRRTLKTDKELGAGGDSSFTEDSGKVAPEAEVDPKAESSFDILDKYRKKTPQDQQAEDQSELTDSAYQSQMKSKDEEEGPPFYDPSNLEGCFAFMDAKRKLRMVLSAGDFLGSTSLHQLMTSQPHSPREFDTGPKKDNDLISLLRAQLAEAINLQNKDVIAQLHEVIRCIRQFDNDGCKKLVKALREEYRSRSAYISYLIRCRQGLLMSHSYLQRLLNRIKRDKEICNKHMVNVCVRLFIERREKNVLYFISDFQKLTVADEKTDLVDRFLQVLYREMEQDSIWKAATENQLIDARLAVERLLMSRVYSHAMFPNGDGDFMRDQLFHQHLKKLSALITPTHKDLCIPRMYHFECPWPAAQREIYMINAYKTPKDKLQCVLRCSTTIMNLLSMANEKSVPAADDFIPVLIFVLIKANPPCLLSTIQYVNSFYESRLAGEEQYWWMQFSSAVEFIKTMDYST